METVDDNRWISQLFQLFCNQFLHDLFSTFFRGIIYCGFGEWSRIVISTVRTPIYSMAVSIFCSPSYHSQLQRVFCLYVHIIGRPFPVGSHMRASVRAENECAVRHRGQRKEGRSCHQTDQVADIMRIKQCPLLQTRRPAQFYDVCHSGPASSTCPSRLVAHALCRLSVSFNIALWGLQYSEISVLSVRISVNIYADSSGSSKVKFTAS